MHPCFTSRSCGTSRAQCASRRRRVDAIGAISGNPSEIIDVLPSSQRGRAIWGTVEDRPTIGARYRVNNGHCRCHGAWVSRVRAARIESGNLEMPTATATRKESERVKKGGGGQGTRKERDNRRRGRGSKVAAAGGGVLARGASFEITRS